MKKTAQQIFQELSQKGLTREEIKESISLLKAKKIATNKKFAVPKRLYEAYSLISKELNR